MRLDGTRVTIATGVLYALGFVIANAHYAQYEPVPARLLHVRYLGAAILFVLFSGLPVAVFVLMRALLGRGGQATQGNLTLAASAALTALVLFGLLAIYNAAGERPVVPVPPFAMWLLLLGFAVQASRVWPPISENIEGSRSAARALAHPPSAVAMVVVALLIALWFGKTVYPRIPASFGGGGGWLVRPQFEPGRASGLDTVKGPILLLDSDEDGATFLTCQGAVPSSVAIILPKEVIKQVAIYLQAGVSDLPLLCERHASGWTLRLPVAFDSVVQPATPDTQARSVKP